MALGLIGKKLGMTQMFDESGSVIPVTVIQAGPCAVIQKKTVETDGYNALKLSFSDEFKEKNLPRAFTGVFKKAGQQVKKHLMEFRTPTAQEFQVGQVLGADFFKNGDYVDVVGTSLGKGFAGTVKRHNFGGGPATHGQSDRQRAPGAIGSNTFPGHVFKGMKMAGHMGVNRRTIQKLKIVFVDPVKNLLGLRGSVPGAVHGIVAVNKTIKRVKARVEAPKAPAAKKADAKKKPAAAAAKDKKK